MTEIRLTQYSHGAGCGCKIAPAVLSRILHTNEAYPDSANLLVGNNTRDDAAVYDLGNGTALISTTDFFMPVVDDPYEFGKIASANAISDVYAMGGRPLLAIAVLGWPVDKIDPDLAQKVIEGSRAVCAEAGISLAGGHSIDNQEPLFGLAVNGIVQVEHLKTNAGASVGDLLYLTKPLGIGILTTAEKKGILKEEHKGLAASWMMRLNKIGAELGKLPYISALTDVTGFGLMGHLIELCEASRVSAGIDFNAVPVLDGIEDYISQKAIPGGTIRNNVSYGEKIYALDESDIPILCDPQTSGGLLVTVSPESKDDFERFHEAYEGYNIAPIGVITGEKSHAVTINKSPLHRGLSRKETL